MQLNTLFLTSFNDAVFSYILALVILVGVLIALYYGLQAFILYTGRGKSLLRPRLVDSEDVI